MVDMSEADYNSVIDDLTRMADNRDEDFMDSVAVAYIIFKHYGDRTAFLWINEMKNYGMPFYWQSLVDGIYHVDAGNDLEQKIKSFIGVCLNNSKLSFKMKWEKRKIERELKKMIGKSELYRSTSDVAQCFKLAALYTLTGDREMPSLVIIGDDAYKKLPHYVQWIEKYMWR